MSLRRAAKNDNNHDAIVSALEGVGVYVVDIREPVDILCGYRGRWVTMEIKDGDLSPSRRRLRPSQKKFFEGAARVGAPNFKVESPEEALRAIGAKVK